MHRKFTERRLAIASHNPGKIQELKALLEPYEVEVIEGDASGLPEPEETGDTFRENAAIKSQFFAKNLHIPALSDDSGLVVLALDGMPGVYSARWAGPDKDFASAMNQLESLLIERTGTASRHSAYFVCALSLCWPDGHQENFEGKVYGKLTFPPRGTNGFGYDPIFIPEGHTITFGEMAPETKHEISHRANAFRQLITACFK